MKVTLTDENGQTVETWTMSDTFFDGGIVGLTERVEFFRDLEAIIWLAHKEGLDESIKTR